MNAAMPTEQQLTDALDTLISSSMNGLPDGYSVVLTFWNHIYAISVYNGDTRCDKDSQAVTFSGAIRIAVEYARQDKSQDSESRLAEKMRLELDDTPITKESLLAEGFEVEQEEQHILAMRKGLAHVITNPINPILWHVKRAFSNETGNRVKTMGQLRTIIRLLGLD